VFTKYVLLNPCRNAKATSTVRFLEAEVFLKFGVAEVLLSDNAKSFMGREMMELLARYHVDHWSTPYHHPQANLTERYIQTVGTAVRCMVHDRQGDHRTWDLELPQIQAAINSLPNESTGLSPFKLNFGREMVFSGREYETAVPGSTRADISEAELLEQFEMLRDRAKAALERAQRRSREQYDKTTSVLKFIVSERVWRRNRVLSDAAEGFSQKLAPKFVPAQITRILGADTYLIADDSGTIVGKYHANDLFKDRISEDI
jgi:hypothetical protein